MIAAAVVGLLLGGLLLTSGDGGDVDGHEGEAAAGASSTTDMPSTTARRTRPSIVRRPTTTTVPAPIAATPVGARVALARDGALALVDIDANTWSVVPIDELALTEGQPNPLFETLARRGSDLVFQTAEGTYAVSPLTPGPARLLAPSIMFVSAAAENEVWVIRPPLGRPASVQRFRTDGTAMSGTIDLPTDWMPVGAVEGGLVLRRGSRFQVWDPAIRSTAFTSEPDVNVIAASGRTVAWHVPCELPVCSLHLTDTVTGADRLVFLGDVQIDWGRAPLSPDGRHLVVHAHRAEDQSSWRPGLLVVDLVAAQGRFVDLTRGDLGGGPMSWSPDGRWLFVLSNAGSANRNVVAYSPDQDEIVELQLPRDARGVTLAAY